MSAEVVSFEDERRKRRPGSLRNPYYRSESRGRVLDVPTVTVEPGNYRLTWNATNGMRFTEEGPCLPQ